MHVMVIFFLAFRCIHRSMPLIRLFRLVLILLLMPTLNFLLVWFALSLFFFQAEDGIRVLTVTGVQTCALPISSLRIALMVSAGVAPWKARLPDSISYTMAPRAKMSERASTACPRTCSGEDRKSVV